MKKKYILLFSFFIFTQILLGQTFDSKQINGQIFADSTSVEAITIVNNTTQHTVITDSNGLFSIPIHEGDVLVFSAINLEGLKRRITPQDMLLDFLSIKMKAKNTELKEVIVNENSNITAESLGIIPYGQKKYTAAERKLYTAQSTILDGLLNGLSGRTKMLKKEIIVEKKERMFYKLETLFEEEYYTNRLKIPQEHIKGFQLHCIDDTEFIKTLETKDKNMIMFALTDLSRQYLEIIPD